MRVLCNAFSLQMVRAEDLSRVRFAPTTQPTPAELACMTSAVGHADTAATLCVQCARINVTLTDGVELVIAQLQGGRLPEGCKSLPAGCSFSWVRAWLE